jgi:hypothetical protein
MNQMRAMYKVNEHNGRSDENRCSYLLVKSFHVLDFSVIKLLLMKSSQYSVPIGSVLLETYVIFQIKIL